MCLLLNQDTHTSLATRQSCENLNRHSWKLARFLSQNKCNDRVVIALVHTLRMFHRFSLHLFARCWTIKWGIASLWLYCYSLPYRRIFVDLSTILYLLLSTRHFFLYFFYPSFDLCVQFCRFLKHHPMTSVLKFHNFWTILPFAQILFPLFTVKLRANPTIHEQCRTGWVILPIARRWQLTRQFRRHAQ